MRIFISYSRVDRAFAQLLERYLRGYKIWYDDRIFAGKRWWEEILDQLDLCDVFVYLISEKSLQSTYCRKEFRIAREKGLPILPIVVESGIRVPSEVSAYQYLDFSEEIDSDTLVNLFSALREVEQQRERAMEDKRKKLNSRADAQAIKVADQKTDAAKRESETDEETDDSSRSSPVPFDSAQAFQQGFDALIGGDADMAVMLFRQIEARGYRHEYHSIPDLRLAAERTLEEQQKNRRRDVEYDRIRQMMRFPNRLIGLAADAFWRFHRDYPEHDPDKFTDVFIKAGYTPPADLQLVAASAQAARYELPQLFWQPIPVGKVRVKMRVQGANGEEERIVAIPNEEYDISRYTVTNEQFGHFVEADDGYRCADWWDFWKLAQVWRRLNPNPLPSRFSGAMHPYVNVSWYEAVAFTRWLSARTGDTILLPTLAQAQRAARGDDERVYPWGDKFDSGLANTLESRLLTTTPVDWYEGGVSPLGVVGCAGNIWQWCYDAYYQPPQMPDTLEDGEAITRSVVGGSHMSNQDAAKIDNSMLLRPEARYVTIGFRIVRLRTSAEPAPGKKP